MAVTGNNGYYIQHTAADDGTGTTYPVKIKCIIWYGVTDATHTLQVKDGNGTIVIPEMTFGSAPALTTTLVIPLNRSLTGVETDILGSGKVTYILD
jgi:hypothetical protein